jgi:hypothetical protein
VGIVISIIVIGTPFHKSSVGIVIYLLLSSGHRSTKPLHRPFAKLEVNSGSPQMTIIYITIPTEDLLNGVYRTIIYITILTEDSRNGIHRTIIYITISTKGVIRIRTSKKTRLYNGQKEKYKRQTTIYKTYT